MKNFQSTPSLETKRCVLRLIEPADSSAIFEMRSNPIMIEFLDAKVDASIEDTVIYIKDMVEGIRQNKWLLWVIEEKNIQQIIGTICIWNFNEDRTCAEIGYGLNPKYRHKGYMFEVLTKVTQFALEVLNLTEVNIFTEKNNLSSRKLAEKCGYQFIKENVEPGIHSTKIYTICVYSKNTTLLNNKCE